jgi:hypothetical protein
LPVDLAQQGEVFPFRLQVRVTAQTRLQVAFPGQKTGNDGHGSRLLWCNPDWRYHGRVRFGLVLSRRCRGDLHTNCRRKRHAEWQDISRWIFKVSKGRRDYGHAALQFTFDGHRLSQRAAVCADPLGEFIVTDQPAHLIEQIRHVRRDRYVVMPGDQFGMKPLPKVSAGFNTQNRTSRQKRLDQVGVRAGIAVDNDEVFVAAPLLPRHTPEDQAGLHDLLHHVRLSDLGQPAETDVEQAGVLMRARDLTQPDALQRAPGSLRRFHSGRGASPESDLAPILPWDPALRKDLSCPLISLARHKARIWYQEIIRPIVTVRQPRLLPDVVAIEQDAAGFDFPLHGIMRQQGNCQ